MAIALDYMSAGTASGTSPVTWTHTCTGSDLVLIVGTSILAGTAAETVTGVTYNGVAMTQIGSALQNGSANLNISLWYLLNPATGPNTISVTKSSIQGCNGIGISLTGVSNYEGQTQTNTTTASPMQTLVTPTAFGAWIVDIVGNTGAGGVTITGIGPQGVRVSAANGSALTTMATFGPMNGGSNRTAFNYTLTGTGFSACHRMATFSPVSFVKQSTIGKIRPRQFGPGLAR